MPRVTVWVPDDLHARIRSELPDINLSRAMQGGLAAALECTHHQLRCERCASVVDVTLAQGAAVHDFLMDVWRELRPLVDRRGTAEGATRIIRNLALRRGIPGARWFHELRPPKPPGRGRLHWKNPYADEERSA